MTDKSIDLERVPRHIAIIMDGNGRWATQKNKPRTYGHQAGVDALRKITTECSNLGVKYLTVYTFSTENWNRPSDEVTALMGLVLTSLEEELFMKNNIRFRVIGDLERLPQDVRKKLDETIQNTRHNDSMTMVIALSYSSKWEITSAVREIASKVSSKVLNPSDINEETVSQHLLTNFMPDPDLLIRTGGELRISNYLLWQIAYAELYFCDTYWPDFNEECLRQAIANYQNRQRRFGKTNAQVSHKIITQDASR
ncbi:MAG: isoprenyl transferase [Prevotella sp.]|nr:isoprenyl transferase [Prevotella sp.]